eukprot:1203718-Amorphochlora_amoeboformis.AAC.1
MLYIVPKIIKRRNTRFSVSGNTPEIPRDVHRYSPTRPGADAHLPDPNTSIRFGITVTIQLKLDNRIPGASSVGEFV